MAFWNREKSVVQCEHRLKMENKDILLSAWELMTENERPSADNIAPWMFEKRVVIDYLCLKCGEIIRIDTVEVAENGFVGDIK